MSKSLLFACLVSTAFSDHTPLGYSDSAAGPQTCANAEACQSPEFPGGDAQDDALTSLLQVNMQLQQGASRQRQKLHNVSVAEGAENVKVIVQDKTGPLFELKPFYRSQLFAQLKDSLDLCAVKCKVLVLLEEQVRTVHANRTLSDCDAWPVDGPCTTGGFEQVSSWEWHILDGDGISTADIRVSEAQALASMQRGDPAVMHVTVVPKCEEELHADIIKFTRDQDLSPTDTCDLQKAFREKGIFSAAQLANCHQGGEGDPITAFFQAKPKVPGFVKDQMDKGFQNMQNKTKNMVSEKGKPQEEEPQGEAANIKDETGFQLLVGDKTGFLAAVVPFYHSINASQLDDLCPIKCKILVLLRDRMKTIETNITEVDCDSWPANKACDEGDFAQVTEWTWILPGINQNSSTTADIILSEAQALGAMQDGTQPVLYLGVSFLCEEGLNVDIIKFTRDQNLSPKETCSLQAEFKKKKVYSMKQLADQSPEGNDNPVVAFTKANPKLGDVQSERLSNSFNIQIAQQQQSQASGGSGGAGGAGGAGGQGGGGGAPISAPGAPAIGGGSALSPITEAVGPILGRKLAQMVPMNDLQKREAQQKKAEDARKNVDQMAKQAGKETTAAAKEALQNINSQLAAAKALQALNLDPEKAGKDAVKGLLDYGADIPKQGKELDLLGLVQRLGLFRGIVISSDPPNMNIFAQVVQLKKGLKEQKATLGDRVIMNPPSSATEFSQEFTSASAMQSATTLVETYGKSVTNTATIQMSGILKTVAGGLSSSFSHSKDSQSQKKSNSQMMQQGQEYFKVKYVYEPRSLLWFSNDMFEPTAELTQAIVKVQEAMNAAQLQVQSVVLQDGCPSGYDLVSTGYSSAVYTGWQGGQNLQSGTNLEACKALCDADPLCAQFVVYHPDASGSQDCYLLDAQGKEASTEFSDLESSRTCNKQGSYLSFEVEKEGCYCNDGAWDSHYPNGADNWNPPHLADCQSRCAVEKDPVDGSPCLFFSYQTNLATTNKDCMLSKSCATCTPGTHIAYKLVHTTPTMTTSTSKTSNSESDDFSIEDLVDEKKDFTLDDMVDNPTEEFETEVRELFAKFGSHVCPNVLLGGYWRLTAHYKSSKKKTNFEMSSAASNALQWSSTTGASVGMPVFGVQAAYGHDEKSNSGTGNKSQQLAQSQDSSCEVDQAWFGGVSGLDAKTWRNTLADARNSNWKVIDRYIDSCAPIWSFINDEKLRVALCRKWASLYWGITSRTQDGLAYVLRECEAIKLQGTAGSGSPGKKEANPNEVLGVSTVPDGPFKQKTACLAPWKTSFTPPAGQSKWSVEECAKAISMHGGVAFNYKNDGSACERLDTTFDVIDESSFSDFWTLHGTCYAECSGDPADKTGHWTPGITVDDCRQTCWQDNNCRGYLFLPGGKVGAWWGQASGCKYCEEPLPYPPEIMDTIKSDEDLLTKINFSNKGQFDGIELCDETPDPAIEGGAKIPVPLGSDTCPVGKEKLDDLNTGEDFVFTFRPNLETGLWEREGWSFYQLPPRYKAIQTNKMCNAPAHELGKGSLWGCALKVAQQDMVYFSLRADDSMCLAKKEQTADCPEGFEDGGGFWQVLQQYRQLKDRALCKAKPKNLGSVHDAQKCAQMARLNGYRFFSFGFDSKQGQCVGSGTSSPTCEEGFMQASFGFYEVLLQPFVVEFNKACNAKGHEMGQMPLWECARAVKNTGAKFFSYTKSGLCLSSTSQGDLGQICPEGFKGDENSDFFFV